jgi:hypothetical protein
LEANTPYVSFANYINSLALQLDNETISIILESKEQVSLLSFGFFTSTLLTYRIICPIKNLGGILLHIEVSNLVRGSENFESPIF